MYRNVLVAYDGTDGARAALRQAVDIVSAGGGALSLAWSVPERSALDPIELRPADPKVAAEARHALEDAIASLDPDLGADPWVVAGPADTAILAVARDIRADLIVTGSRGRGRVARSLLGSVSSELVHKAHCDVLVVHPDEPSGAD
jgi:nucleotide-binding universal stress UspA family protein